MNFKDLMLVVEMAKGKLEKEFISGKQYPINERFDYWNRKLFGGKLIKPELVLKVIRGASGEMSYIVDRRTGTIQDAKEWRLKIDPKGKRTMEGWDGVLIHEMVHLFFHLQYLGKKVTEYRKDLGKDGHAEPFVKKIKELSNKVDFVIPLSDEQTGRDNETPLKAPVYFMVHQASPSQYGVLVFNKSLADDPRFKQMVTSVRDMFLNRNTNFAAGITNDPGLNGITVKRTMPRGRSVNWTLLPKETAENLLKLGVNI